MSKCDVKVVIGDYARPEIVHLRGPKNASAKSGQHECIPPANVTMQAPKHCHNIATTRRIGLMLGDLTFQLPRCFT